MQTSISSISDIRIGYPGQPEPAGTVMFLQLRQFNEDGNFISEAADFTKLDEKSHLHLLNDGDVLFVGKGHRLFAWCYKDEGTPVIASSSFFVLRTNSSKVHPEYLTAFLNAPQTKAALIQLGGGTNIFSIRKSELGAFQIPVLPMDKQKRVAALAALHLKDIQLEKELIVQKQTLYTAIISKLIK